MPSVGTAFVNIRVNTKGFESGLDSMLKRLSTKMEAAGTKLGKDFERGLGKTNFDSVFDRLTTSSDRATDKVANDINKITTESRVAKDALGDLTGELNDAASASRRVNLGGIGGGGGARNLRAAAGDANSFTRALDKMAVRAAADIRILERLHDAEAFVGTALAGAISGLSAAAQGIFAVGANAASAVPALAVFTNGLIGMAQVGSTIGLAMAGVGNAVTAGFTSLDKTAADAAKSTTGLGDATAAAARAVRDAKEALQNAYQDAARAAEDAARRTADAERALALAQQATTVAQQNLNAARAEGIQQLKEIAFAAEEASLSEQEAALNLQDAQDQLAATAELAPDDEARVRAVLNYKEAELALREAKNARQQADKDQQQADQEGIKGTDAVTSAQQDLTDAQNSQADAVRALQDARREEARTAQDNAQSIADAQQALADAQNQLAAAQKKGTDATTAAATAVDAYQLALSKLGPEQQRFVRRLVGMRDAFLRVRGQIADPLFAGLNDSLDILLSGSLLPRLQTQLTNTSANLGDFTVKAARLAENDVFQNSFIRVLRGNNRNMGLWGDTLLNLADAFVQIADAARPLTRRFSLWLEQVSESWSKTLRAKNATGELSDTINTAGDRVAEFWQLAKELWRTLVILGTAANRAANGFGDMGREGERNKDKHGYITTLADNLQTFNDKLEKNHGLVGRFHQALLNLNAVSAALKTVFQPFIDMGQDKAVETAFRTIAESDAFSRIGKQANQALPAFAKIVVHVLDFMAALSESHAIDNFLQIMERITGVLAKVTQLLANMGILRWIGYVTAAFAAWRLLRRGFQIAVSPFILLAKGFSDFMVKIRTARASGKGLFGSFAAGFKAGPAATKVAGAGQAAEEGTWEAEVLVHLKGIIAAIDTCCATLSRVMASGAAEGALGGAAGAGTLGAAPAFGGAAASEAGAVGAIGGEAAQVGRFAGVFGKFARFAGPVSKLMKPLSLGIRAIGGAMRFALGPWGMLVLTILPLMWPLLVQVEEKTGIFSKTLAVLADAVGWLWEKLQEAFNWIKDNWPLLLGILTGPIGLAVLFITQHFGQILDFVKELPGKIGGFLAGMWDAVTDGLRKAWDGVQRIWGNIVAWVKGRPAAFGRMLRKLWDMFKTGLRLEYQGVRIIWNRIVDWVKGFPNQFKRLLGKVWDILSTALRNDWALLKTIWGRITDWVKGFPAQFGRILSKVWDVLKTGLGTAWDWVKRKWEDIKNAVSNWPDQIGRSLKHIFDGIGQGVISAVNWVGGKVNWMIGKINSVTDKFGGPQITVTWPDLSWPGHFAEGGPVRGPGGPKSDQVLARLSNGEYVLPTRAAKGIGPDHLEYMRKYGTLPPMGDPGLFSGIANAVGSVAGAISNGAEYAIKWALGSVIGQLEGVNLIGDIVKSILTWAADHFTSWGEEKDAEIAKKQALQGGADVVVSDPSNPRGLTTWHGGTFTRRFVAHLQKAQKLANSNIVVIQGGFRPATSYSGTSHQGDAIDTAVVYRVLYALRRVGIASGDRTGLGNWAPHIHAIPGPKAGYAAGSAVWQWTDYVARGGAKQSPRSPWGLAEGGIVAPSSMGTLALLAEAGRPERVTPLDSQGFTPAEREMLRLLDESLNGDGGSGDTFIVQPAPGMDETALADKVARRVSWNRRRGARRR